MIVDQAELRLTEKEFINGLRIILYKISVVVCILTKHTSNTSRSLSLKKKKFKREDKA